MSDLCIVCKKIVKERQEALMCEGGCESWQHSVCGIPIDRAFYRRLVKGEIDYQWNCNSCQIIDNTPAPPPLLPDMLNFSSPAAERTHQDLLQIPANPWTRQLIMISPNQWMTLLLLRVPPFSHRPMIIWTLQMIIRHSISIIPT